LLKHQAPLIHANKPTLRLDKRIRKPGLSNDLRIEVDSLNFGDTLSKNNLSSDQLLDIPISSHLEDNLPSKESIRKNNRNAFNLHKIRQRLEITLLMSRIKKTVWTRLEGS